MVESIHESVSVVLVFNTLSGRAEPVKVKWRGRVYPIRKIGYHHLAKQGKKLFHIFSAVSDTLFFRLALDTENLHWTLEEVASES